MGLIDKLWLASYNALVLVGLLLGWPVLLYSLLATPKYRAGLGQKLGLKSLNIPPKPSGLRRYWVHCVSVGELNAAQPLINALMQNADVVITTTTATGQALAKTRYAQVCYCPLDTVWTVKHAMETIQPDALLILETELWPNLFAFAHHYCPGGVWVVNARLSEKSFNGYQRFKPFFGWVLSLPRGILAQSSADAERFKQLGSVRVAVMGNLKFELNPCVLPELSVHWQTRLNASRTVVFASTHDTEEALLLPAIKQLVDAGIRVVIAPRHPERGHAVAQQLTDAGCLVVRQSTQTEGYLPVGVVLVLDTIGQLMAVFSRSHLAIMGGSFIPWGGQNPLEPLALGVPTIVGPYMHNFKAVVSTLQEADALVTATDVPDLQHQLAQWQMNPDQWLHKVRNGQSCIKASQGATQRILEALQANSVSG